MSEREGVDREDNGHFDYSKSANGTISEMVTTGGPLCGRS